MKVILPILLIEIIYIAAFAGDSSENVLKHIQAQIQKIEARCTPGKGLTRKDVEKIFGKGKPAANSKNPPKIIPKHSPYRTYELCKNGTLFVFYKNDVVVRANFINPYSTKGIPEGMDIPIDQKIREARKRLSQMEMILKVYLKKLKKL